MNTIKGKIDIEKMYVGSKSEGEVALLTDDNGKTYTLYRAGYMPQNDRFFASVNQATVEVYGSIEEENGYICVEQITLADGTKLVAKENESPRPSPSIFINNDTSNEPSIVNENGKKERLPRKLKKELKKRLKNK